MNKIVFDLDGTLADCRHRLKHIEKTPRDWEKFHKACGRDSPIRAVVACYTALHISGWRLCVWSGRCESQRPRTIKWFRKHNIPWPSQVLMRPYGDHREDTVLKARWADLLGDPWLVYDDRRRVADMWRARGVLCCHVGGGDF